ncbi:MAG: YkgJ family cysteine cluster protein [Verrucomicrobiota bacterium]|nr:YkgJ family cysteine cluster protein [Verrucomicrobiota bacterium]
MRRDNAETLAQTRAIYAELETRPIDRQCTRLTQCCQFRLTGRTPFLTRGEALVAANALRASGRKRLPESLDGACPMMQHESGRCMIYADRPFACRTHFCAAAGGPYPRREVADLIHRLEAIDARLGGNGASSLVYAVDDALACLG